MFIPTQKQLEAIDLISHKNFILLYGGARSGKTFKAVRTTFVRALKEPRSTHLFCRLRFRHCKQSLWYGTVPKVREQCFPGLQWKENKSDWFIELPNRSVIWFGGVDDKERLEKLLGLEFSTIFAEECSQISYNAYQILSSRLSEKNGLVKRYLLACNPPSKKHFTYDLFIRGIYPGTTMRVDPAKYGAILMNPTDNIENLPSDYIQNNLETLSERKRLRFLHGQFVDDVEGALWTIELIERQRSEIKTLEELSLKVGISYLVIGVDPSVSNKQDSALTGIVLCAKGNDGKFYVITDKSIQASPNTWATVIVNLYNTYKVNAVVVETNQGGDLVKTLLLQLGFRGRIIEVRASQSKHARAEPIVALYERDLVMHLDSNDLSSLEDELTNYSPLQVSKSPDRLDAMVWALTYLSSTIGRDAPRVSFV